MYEYIYKYKYSFLKRRIKGFPIVVSEKKQTHVSVNQTKACKMIHLSAKRKYDHHKVGNCDLLNCIKNNHFRFTEIYLGVLLKGCDVLLKTKIHPSLININI